MPALNRQQALGAERQAHLSGPELVIHTSHLTKRYGKSRGIDDVGLDVRSGEVFGYLGPNGAGKTTTIRVLMDFIRPTRGDAVIFGLDCRRDSVDIHRRVGYLPGELSVYDNLTGDELLTYVGNLHGGADWAFVSRLARRLECDLTRRIRTLSHGNRQKIGLIQAFMHRPELIILDEPTVGLDPLMQQEFYHLVTEAKAEGRTVFISSHNLPEVERMCDRVGIIRAGTLVATESIESLKSRAARHLEIRFAAPIPQNAFSAVPGICDLTVSDTILTCTVMGSLDALVKMAARYEVVTLVSHEPSLEDVFLAYYGEGKGHV